MFGAQQRCAVHTSGLSAKYDDGHMDLRLEQSLSLLNGRITIEDFFDGLFAEEEIGKYLDSRPCEVAPVIADLKALRKIAKILAGHFFKDRHHCALPLFVPIEKAVRTARGCIFRRYSEKKKKIKQNILKENCVH